MTQEMREASPVEEGLPCTTHLPSHLFIWIARNPNERPPAVLSYDLLVAKWDSVQPHHVRQAAAEYDQLGQDEFLARHGFGHALAYLLILDDKSYDSKAILGVAYGYATGRPLGPHDFSGGVHGAAGVLRSLGFEIVNTRDRDPSK
jgi:hypothetical protein